MREPVDIDRMSRRVLSLEEVRNHALLLEVDFEARDHEADQLDGEENFERTFEVAP